MPKCQDKAVLKVGDQSIVHLRACADERSGTALVDAFFVDHATSLTQKSRQLSDGRGRMDVVHLGLKWCEVEKLAIMIL